MHKSSWLVSWSFSINKTHLGSKSKGVSILTTTKKKLLRITTNFFWSKCWRYKTAKLLIYFQQNSYVGLSVLAITPSISLKGINASLLTSPNHLLHLLLIYAILVPILKFSLRILLQNHYLLRKSQGYSVKNARKKQYLKNRLFYIPLQNSFFCT